MGSTTAGCNDSPGFDSHPLSPSWKIFTDDFCSWSPSLKFLHDGNKVYTVTQTCCNKANKRYLIDFVVFPALL